MLPRRGRPQRFVMRIHTEICLKAKQYRKVIWLLIVDNVRIPKHEPPLRAFCPEVSFWFDPTGVIKCSRPNRSDFRRPFDSRHQISTEIWVSFPQEFLATLNHPRPSFSDAVGEFNVVS